MNATMNEDGVLAETQTEKYHLKTPLDRVGQPTEVGGAAVFLSSDLVSYVTATALVVGSGILGTTG
jgi:3-oxoacyl-[acyl-carrier protein] reductase